MYYYGGYSGGNTCGCGGYQSYGYPNYGYGYGGTGYGAAIILVLFILLVIIIGCRACSIAGKRRESSPLSVRCMLR